MHQGICTFRHALNKFNFGDLESDCWGDCSQMKISSDRIIETGFTTEDPPLALPTLAWLVAFKSEAHVQDYSRGKGSVE